MVFLSQVANCVSTNHYTTVMRHAVSLQWIFDKIRQDYDITHKGIHFLNLSRLKYDPDTMTPARFYQLYRAHIINHTARAGQTIQWNNNQLLAHDEVIGAAFEDHILYSVIALIDSRLIDHISQHYQLKLTDGQRLMDIRADIFVNIPKFLEEINIQLGAISLQMSPTISPPSQLLAIRMNQETYQPTPTARPPQPHPPQPQVAAPAPNQVFQQPSPLLHTTNHP